MQQLTAHVPSQTGLAKFESLLGLTRGWSGGAMVLGAGGGCLDSFTLIYPFSPLSPSLGDGPI